MKPWIVFAKEMRETGATVAVEIVDKKPRYFVPKINRTISAFWFGKLLESDLIRPLENCIDPRNPQEYEFADEE